MKTRCKREELIERYENIVKKWQGNSDLLKLFPEKYKEMVMKLEALKNGNV